MNQEEALRAAEKFLEASRNSGEPELKIDYGLVEEKGGILIVPYNSAQYLTTRNVRDMLLDCWPILVELDSGSVRFGELGDRPLWNE
ncbi:MULTISPECIES: YrhB domain-containing protein [unclassified Streptomyces]|uniref:YrhB domain-containing protein n=1 Tax=unclassified Streptomyces TaxID=2593676 RepID=UPI000A308671|nr:YrhB domain-containing protein [Streptomyces sp. BoleA5]MYX37828.1 hypothetical protein [Streptomyces sp. SID8377]